MGSIIYFINLIDAILLVLFIFAFVMYLVYGVVKVMWRRLSYWFRDNFSNDVRRAKSVEDPE